MTSSRSRGKSIARTDCRQRVKRSPSLRPMTITETSGSVTLGDSGDITSDYECDRYDVKVESGIDERPREVSVRGATRSAASSGRRERLLECQRRRLDEMPRQCRQRERRQEGQSKERRCRELRAQAVHQELLNGARKDVEPI